VVEEAFLRGALLDLPARDFTERFAAWTRVRWVPPAWGMVDPVREADAARAAVNNGLSTLAEECAANGRDWQEVMAQRAREETMRQALGLPATPPPPAGVAPTPETEAPEAPAPRGNALAARPLTPEPVTRG
jgi:capsid protein